MELDIVEKKNRIRDSADKKISIALMASFVILTIQYFVLIFFNLRGTLMASSIQLLSKGLVGLAFLYALPVVFKRSKIKLIGIYFITILIIAFNYALFTDNKIYLKEMLFPIFFISLPAFVYSMSINNLSVFKEFMKKASYIVFLFGVLLGVLIFSGRVFAGEYSMSLSYYMLLPTIMFIDELFEKFSFRIVSFIMVSSLVILSLGSRGAILCIFIFVILKFLRQSSKRTYKTVIEHFSLIGIGIIILLSLNQIIESVYVFLLKFDINSRTLILFLKDEVHLSGRDIIYTDVLTAFRANPIFGLGLVGDRVVLNGIYSHNFFIEILSNFGIVIGMIILIGVMVLLLKRLTVKEIFKYNLIIIWISLGFVHLMVSGTYIVDIKFWILMGLLINPKIRKSSSKYIT